MAPAADSASPGLWPEIRVLERGWLSANNYLFQGPEGAALVDTGYCTHSPQTVALVHSALAGQPLARILNTHLHSDHCGGNAALQAAYPQLHTWIPPGHAAHVQPWNAVALGYIPTGQQCPPFRFDALLQPGHCTVLGGREWQIHAAPGHDPHSILLFEPEKRILISADALWQNGFGVVFPELDGKEAFHEVADTLDLIEQLQPATVLPGHGAVFTDVDAALAEARRKLAGFVADPLKHARYAAKVLFKYKLLEWQQIALNDAVDWAERTPYVQRLHRRYFGAQTLAEWISAMVGELARAGAAEVQDGVLYNR